MKLGNMAAGKPQRGACLLALPVCLLLACSLSAIPPHPQSTLPPLELLKRLNSVALDPTQVYAIRDAHITRGRMDLYLNRGFIAFMTPVQGEVTGAVFWGEGEVLMIPPNRAEKRNLAQFTHSPILEEKIESVYLRFTDHTAQELLAASRPPDPDDPEQPGPVVEEWAGVAQALNVETSVRILTDLLGDRNHPYFYARVKGETLGVFEMVDDERLAEPFSIASMRKVGSQDLHRYLVLLPHARFAGGPGCVAGVAAKALAYTLDVRIHPDHSLEGRAEIQLESRSAQDRVISFDLSRWLAVTGVEDDHGQQYHGDRGAAAGGGARRRRALTITSKWCCPTPIPSANAFA